MESSVNPGKNSYDQVPYMGRSYSVTHPDAMAAAGVLLGLNPPDVEHCRVLELGCANGSNLMPMAMGLPDSRFIGLDSSEVQIFQGQQSIERLGLGNIQLKCLNILDVDASLGTFDYIIVHGIYSWVPEKVKDKILAICHDNLAPEGIAYVSYNTFPGWHQHRIARDLMLYHTRKVNDPRAKIQQARSFLDFMAKATDEINKQAKNRFGEAYASILRHENDRLGDSSDTYLFHEELEENNDPLYFYQFADRADRHGLQYLSEASLSKAFMEEVPRQIKDDLLKMSADIVELEQYRDFLTNRFFRSTLLVHKDIKVSRLIRTDRLADLYVGSGCLPESSGPDICGPAVEKFVCSNETQMATDHPVTKAALFYLGDIWPQVIKADDLLARAYAYLRRVSPPGVLEIPANAEALAQDMQTLRANLLKGFVASPPMVEFHVYAPRFSTRLSEYPVASPWVRFQIENEAEIRKSASKDRRERFSVTNLRHERIELEDPAPFLLYQMDGSCSRNELLARLVTYLAESGTGFPVREGDVPVDQQQVKRPPVGADLDKMLEEELKWILRGALLVA